MNPLLSDGAVKWPDYTQEEMGRPAGGSGGWVVAATAIFACGGTTASSPASDGGQHPDAQEHIDAGHDAGRPHDGGAPPDAPAVDVIIEGGATHCSASAPTVTTYNKGCTTGVTGGCENGDMFKFNCLCPQATCTCDVTYAAGGHAGMSEPYAGCASCTAAPPWSNGACAALLSMP